MNLPKKPLKFLNAAGSAENKKNCRIGGVFSMMKSFSEFKRKRVLRCIIVIIAAALLLYGLFFYFFRSMSRLPEGEYLYSSNNPTGEYRVNVYLCYSSLSADAVRAETENTDNGKRRNVYWCYRRSSAEIKWTGDYEAVINGEKLNILKDRYDWRKDRHFDKKEELNN
mgnify:FL=1